MKNFRVLWALVCGVILAGCSHMDSVPTAECESAAMDFAAPMAGVAPKAMNRSMAAAGSVAGDSGSKMGFFASERKLIFTARMLLEVKELSVSLEQIRSEAESLGGYLLRSSNDAVSLKIPLENAEAFASTVARFGRVLERELNTQDVTEEMFDLEMRLGNLKKMREKLLEIAAKANTVEDMLKVETELNRLTGEIEQLEGRQKFLVNQTSFATFHINLTVPSPQQMPVRNVPFAWIARLGEGLFRNYAGDYVEDSLPFDFELPEGFVPVSSSRSGDTLVAVTAQQGVLRLSRVANHTGGTLAFWRQIVSSALTEQMFNSLTLEHEILIGEQRRAVEFVMPKYFFNEDYLCSVVIFTNYDQWCVPGNGDIFILEFAAPKEEFEQRQEAIGQALDSVDLSMWR